MLIRWRSGRVCSSRKIYGKLRNCLLGKGSLIQYLERFAPEKLSLLVTTQSYKKPHLNESNILNLRRGEYVLLRETLLTCHAQPWVHARTVVPLRTLRSARRLASWDDQPLSDYLFSHRFIYRGDIEIFMPEIVDIPYNRLQSFIVDHDSLLWARRSVFYIKNKPLLLTEIFLPEAIKCINS